MSTLTAATTKHSPTTVPTELNKHQRKALLALLDNWTFDNQNKTFVAKTWRAKNKAPKQLPCALRTFTQSLNDTPVHLCIKHIEAIKWHTLVELLPVGSQITVSDTADNTVFYNQPM